MSLAARNACKVRSVFLNDGTSIFDPSRVTNVPFFHSMWRMCVGAGIYYIRRVMFLSLATFTSFCCLRFLVGLFDIVGYRDNIWTRRVDSLFRWEIHLAFNDNIVSENVKLRARDMDYIPLCALSGIGFISLLLMSSTLTRIPIPGQFVVLDYKNYCWIFNALLNFHASTFWSLDVWECDQARGQINHWLNSTYAIYSLQYTLQHIPPIICTNWTQQHVAATLSSQFLRNFSLSPSFPLVPLCSLFRSVYNVIRCVYS